VRCWRSWVCAASWAGSAWADAAQVASACQFARGSVLSQTAQAALTHREAQGACSAPQVRPLHSFGACSPSWSRDVETPRAGCATDFRICGGMALIRDIRMYADLTGVERRSFRNAMIVHSLTRRQHNGLTTDWKERFPTRQGRAAGAFGGTHDRENNDDHRRSRI
jgi:hypothetical protein